MKLNRIVGVGAVVVVLIFLSGCRCKSIAPISHVQFKLLDAGGVNLLDSVYTTLNYELSDGVAKTYYAERKDVDGGAVLRIAYDNLVSADDYYLRFSNTDIDTVSIKYTSEKGKCHEEYNLIEFQYNGEIYTPGNTGNTFNVSK